MSNPITSIYSALCSHVDAARQVAELQQALSANDELILHLQDALEKSDIRAAMLQEELEAEQEVREAVEERRA